MFEIRLTRKIYSQRWFVKEKSFCCTSVVAIHSLASQFPAMSNDNTCINCLKGNSKAKIDELRCSNRLNKERSTGMGIDPFLVPNWRFFKDKSVSVISPLRVK